MSARTHVAAVDLGAESGRVASVAFDGERLDLQVAHRFTHQPHEVDGIVRWDLDGLWGGIRQGLARLAGGEHDVASVGVDAWGVDYGLLDADGELVDQPTCYRDDRQPRARAEVLAEVGADRIYSATGVQVIDINTIFALVSDAREHPQRLERAATLLMMPDVVHHLLSGSRVTEHTAASTTGFYETGSSRWTTDLLDELGVPTHLLPEVVAPGTDVGALLPDLATGRLAGARVLVPPGHDTASAVVGTPLHDPGSLYISSGTWSLVGVEVDAPVVSAATRAANMTNEGGYAGTVRLLRNVTGLWVLQSCRRWWQRQGTELSYPELVELAAGVPGLRGIVNPDAPEFLDGRRTPERIAEYCERTGTPAPQGIAETTRVALDSLALAYRHVVEDLAVVTGSRVPSVNVVGGGSNNTLLSQLTADACGVPVFCGPVEATALGNAATQLAALGELGDLHDIRRVVAATEPVTPYAPRGGEGWDAAYEHFTRLVARDRERQGLGVAAGD
ncbi:rhamnulokinase [Lapillicoccus jejuensis]|uniref:L-rhamnulokinase n=1 Tax=Lapillicoccus jejuensis TaxID=402171 RepID=A0A542DVA9_9MICO|nr:rhamnulokinase family protein [Lapillicoccus jejuensis]TQJ07032.1 L-rhamnulokinase [Lapillicoccus jejuensis]